MATQILYTTIESIRACVGLDAADVPDSLITDQGLRIQFIIDLDTWYSGDYETDWDASGFDPLDVSDIDIVSASVVERKGYLLSAYSMWFAASKLLETLLVMPQKISDGKDELQRFSGINLEKMLERVKGNAASLKAVIVNEAASTTTAVLGASRVESQTYDPITGA